MIARLPTLWLSLCLLAGCVSFPDAAPETAEPHIEDETIVSFDGAGLGLTSWIADDAVAAVVAIHGMNDYAGAFAYAGPYWAGQGISVYAYDQRGFGRSPAFGRWAGAAAMKKDVRAAIAAVRADNPDLPIYVVGHSMGAAVILASMMDEPLPVEGVVLAAPGIWGGASMSIFYRATLNLAAAFAPGKTLTGERAGRQASDNIEFLQAMYEDPLVIKDTRIDAILGAERLMGEGYDATNEVEGDILFLFGARDDIIPLKQLRKSARRLCRTAIIRQYPDSWHMIFADHGRETPMLDVALWIKADIGGDKSWRPQDETGNSVPAVSNCAGPNG